MTHRNPRRFPTALKATALTVALLAGGAVYGGSTASASAPPAAVRGQAVLGDLRAPSTGEAATRRALRALEASHKGRIGGYAIDLATGKTVAYRSGELFPMLSTFKAMAAAAVLHKARTSDPGLMERVVRWTAAEVKPGSPITENHVADGLTVAQLCKAAITRSDNTAGNMLLKQLGGPAGLTRYLRTLKDPISRLDRWETELNDWTPKERRDTTTPRAMARDLSKVTAGDALNPKDRATLNGWLRASETGDARIRAGLPKSWTIGDKTGTGSAYGVANDIAVIWPDKAAAPIIMSIYTNRRAADGVYDDKVIADTATILARGLGRLPKN
ncbi:class A beta-lactamase [Streptosporangium sp. KLBMP 9127]|nr:class A beta-lactamase [Streptosporangium sp. KLBMP 9127]